MIREIVFAIVCLVSSFFAFAVPPIEAYGHLPCIDMMGLSPSGSRYAFIVTVGEERRLAVAASGSNEAIFSVKTGDAKVRKLQWIGEERLLVWTSSTFNRPFEFKSAYELLMVRNIDLKNRTMTSIFGSARKVANIVLGFAGTSRAAEQEYGYFVGLTLQRVGDEYVFNGDQRDLYRVNLASNETALVARGIEDVPFEWIVGDDGEVLAHSEYDRASGTWRLYAGGNRDKLLLERTSPFGDIDLIGRGRTPHTVWIVDGTSSAAVAEEVSVTDGKTETVLSDFSPRAFFYDPVDHRAIGAAISEAPGAFFYNERLQARFLGSRKAFPTLQMQLVSFSQNLDRLIVKTDGRDDSGTYWLVDIAGKKADPIGYPYPEIRPADVGPTQWIDYSAGDGLEMRAVLTLPPGRKSEKLPLIVLPHGGPIGVRDDLTFDWWAQAYASAGYAVLQPNYRGSGGVSKEFEAAGYGEWGRKMQTDLSDGVAALAARGVIDPKRVCIVGASYGGYAALAGATMQPGIYRCAVSVAGPSDMPQFFRWQVNTKGYKSDNTRYWRAVTGADKEGDGVMKALSPANFAEQANAPILLMHGKDDTVVPIVQSEIMVSALRAAKKPVEFLEMAGEDHWLSREATRKAMLKASVAFVQKHNPPD